MGGGGGRVLDCQGSDLFMLYYSFLHHVWNSCMQEHCKYLLKIIIAKYSKLAERIGPCNLISVPSFIEIFLMVFKLKSGIVWKNNQREITPKI